MADSCAEMHHADYAILRSWRMRGIWNYVFLPDSTSLECQLCRLHARSYSCLIHYPSQPPPSQTPLCKPASEKSLVRSLPPCPLPPHPPPFLYLCSLPLSLSKGSRWVMCMACCTFSKDLLALRLPDSAILKLVVYIVSNMCGYKLRLNF